MTSKVETIYSQRRKKLLANIRGEAMLLYSAPTMVESRDLDFPYRQESNFLYLSGFEEPDSALLLLGNSSGPRTILFLKERDPARERWTGEILGTKRAKRRFDIDEIRNIKDFKKDLPELLCKSTVLHYAPGINTQIDTFIFSLFQNNTGPRLNFPHTLKDSRILLSEMRFVKDREEIRTIKHAVDITAHGLIKLLPQLRNVSSEKHCAKLLESIFFQLGASGLAFSTIVASGKNATCLHHSPGHQPLWKRDLVLLDAGARFRSYTGDISRTVPASGAYSAAQAQIYDLTLKALRTGIRNAKIGKSLSAIHLSIVQEVTIGLVELKILKGNVTDLIAKDAYKKYYMHRSGHWLGIDVHDITPLSYKHGQFISSYEWPLVAGTVFTIEPGIYIDNDDTSVPKHFRGIGVRIEEDILITESGHQILSEKIPVERDQIEAIMR